MKVEKLEMYVGKEGSHLKTTQNGIEERDRR